MIPISQRYRSTNNLGTVDTTDFQYANYDLFHVAHDKAILEATLLDNRGNKVAEAGGLHNYLANRSMESLNHNNSLAGFFFEHEFPYYSKATTAGPLNHRFIDRIGSDGQTFQDYVGHNWYKFQVKLLLDHHANQFRITDDFYRWIQHNHPSYLEHHPNIYPASHDLGFAIDNKRVEHDLTDARHAELHPLTWFLEDFAFTEASIVGSIIFSTLVFNRNLDHIGISLFRAGSQQGFVMGGEALIDLIPNLGIGALTGHALIEGHNLEMYGGLSALYAAGELLFTQRDLSRCKAYTIVSQRSAIIGTKIGISKVVAIVGAKVAGLSAKGATLGTTFGPVGTAIGCGIGLTVGLGGGWWFYYKDKQIAEKHAEIFVNAIRHVLNSA